MSVIKKVLSKIIYAIAKTLSIIMGNLIQIIETIVLIVKSISKGFLVLVSMGGCLFFLLFIGPLGFRILTDPVAFVTVLFFLLFPIIGTKAVAYLKYLKYSTTEFLFNLANYLMDGTNYQYKSFSEYKVDYIKAEEEKIREEQRRYYEQKREWEERFRQWNQQNYQSGQGSYGGYEHNFTNPIVEFKNIYEKSCDVLGVPYYADKYQIKLAYRRKAKKYHPDVNNAPEATKMFQEISDAYGFLNDDNIQRYKNI